MRRKALPVFAFVLALMPLAAISSAGAVTLEIDPVHSVAGFKVRHMMISNVTGEFGKTTGVINYDPADVTKSTVEATIDATTINTRVPDRDNHLKSPAFFDVEKFPTITFKSKKVEKAGEGKLKVTGDLTIKGVTKEVSIDFAFEGSAKDPFGNDRIGFEGSVPISRKDFGVNCNAPLETGGVLVSDKVVLEFEISAIKAA